MEQQQIESGLASMRTTLELLDSTIKQKIARKKELKELVAEDARLNKEIGKLKKDRNGASSKMNWLVEFFKGINGGQFPDGMFPLFAEANKPVVAKEVTVVFIGYQKLINGFEPMFVVSNLPGFSMPTSLLERSVIEKGLAVPEHPSYAEWRKSRRHNQETVTA